jgi:hypothetical protein
MVGNEGSHKILHVGMPSEFEAVQDVLIFCKVNLHEYIGQQIVFKINVRLEGQSLKEAAQAKDKHDLVMYMSGIHKEPNEDNHHLMFTYKKKIIFNPRALPTINDPKTGQPAVKDTLYVTFLAGKSYILNV